MRKPFLGLTRSARTLGVVVLAASPLLLSACAWLDPLDAPGRWRPNDANDADLAVEVESPSDLLHGRSDPVGDPTPAVAAVVRYRTGTVKPLPDSSLTDIKLGPNGDQADAPAPQVDGGATDGH